MKFNKAIFLSIALLSTAGLMQAMQSNITNEEIRSGARPASRWVKYDPSTNQYVGNLPGMGLTPEVYMDVEEIKEVNPSVTNPSEYRNLNLRNKYSTQNPAIDSEALKYKALFDESGERIK